MESVVVGMPPLQGKREMEEQVKLVSDKCGRGKEGVEGVSECVHATE